MQISSMSAIAHAQQLESEGRIPAQLVEHIRGLLATNSVNGMVDTSILPEVLRSEFGHTAAPA